MSKTTIAIVLSLIVGFAAARWLDVGDDEPGTEQAGAPAPLSFDTTAPAEQRLRALEQAVSDERQARQLLQEEVLILTDELDRLTGGGLAAEIADEQAVAVSPDTRRDRSRSRFTAEGRAERLVEAGFEPSRADWIVQRESELQMEALQARYEAERSGDPASYYASRAEAANALRQELGDADYERYLEANGRSTSVAISNVMESSPAQRAGLQIGDQILRYDGLRIFSMSDLSRQTMAGEPGVNIVVDIVRDGTPMQVVLPRGPVGISTGRRRSR